MSETLTPEDLEKQTKRAATAAFGSYVTHQAAPTQRAYSSTNGDNYYG